MIYLSEKFKEAWKGKDPFVEVDKLDGEVFRLVKNRRTLRFALNGDSYFAKIHHGVGWREIFKNLSQFKVPVLGAQNEFAAIRKLEELGVETMSVCAYGKRGANPAGQDSFIVTEDLINTESLEDYCRDWKKNPPSFRVKRALIERLAWVSRQLHTNGVNHRDYYICHFLLDVSEGRNIDPDHFKASLIDLHRTQIRRKTPLRWVVKDVGGLYFSALDIGLTSRDCLRFMKIYSDLPLRELLKDKRDFWRRVKSSAEKLYKKEFGCAPEGIHGS